MNLARTAAGHRVLWSRRFYEDLVQWRDLDPVTGSKVVRLVKEILATPKRGIGRPKRLAGVPGLWSRRIDREHRLFFVVEDGTVRFLSCRGHDLHPRMRELLLERAR